MESLTGRVRRTAKIISDEEFAALLKQRKQLDRPEHDRRDNAGIRAPAQTTVAKSRQAVNPAGMAQPALRAIKHSLFARK